MPRHEHYEELCALAVLGELGREEFDELRMHTRACSACERALHDYNDVIQNIPLEHVPGTESQVKVLQDRVSAESFIQRARQEGVVFSNEALQSVKPRPPLRSIWTRPMVHLNSAVVAVLVVAVGVGTWLLATNKPAPPVANSQEHVPPPLPIKETPVVHKASDDAQTALRTSQAEVASLQTQIAQLKQQMATSVDRVNANQTQSDATLHERNATIANLSAQLDALKLRISDETAALQKAQGDRDQAVAAFVEQQSQIHSLQSDVKLAMAKVDQEKQLNAAAHDVRELMGARKLHIIDVYDAENPDTQSKSFGRIIYMEGKSLIFYAFDLDQLHRGTKVSFQAWGEHSGGQQRARNLGVFSLDDEAQKRWVLKINDPAALKLVDTIYVTVESHLDAPKPSGERYLKAYLGSRPNHP